MTSSISLVAGLLVGFSVAAPVGPMGLLCIQRTLASGMGVGFSTGLGGATANVIYGLIVILGLERMTGWIESSGRVLSALGGLFLLWSAAKTLMRRPASGPRADNSVQLPLPAYASAVFYNLTNPTSVILILALLAPVVGVSATNSADAAALLVGMFIAVAGWWLGVTGSVALLRSRLSPAAVTYINRGAGMVLTVYGLMALLRSASM